MNDLSIGLKPTSADLDHILKQIQATEAEIKALEERYLPQGVGALLMRAVLELLDKKYEHVGHLNELKYTLERA